jgi:LuxR family maltose regulon positive regulatory protein
VLVNEVAAMLDNFALVLDDYHLIEAKPLHDAVAFFLEHMPPQMHLITASGIPPLRRTRFAYAAVDSRILSSSKSAGLL